MTLTDTERYFDMAKKLNNPELDYAPHSQVFAYYLMDDEFLGDVNPELDQAAYDAWADEVIEEDDFLPGWRSEGALRA